MTTVSSEDSSDPGQRILVITVISSLKVLLSAIAVFLCQAIICVAVPRAVPCTTGGYTIFNRDWWAHCFAFGRSIEAIIRIEIPVGAVTTRSNIQSTIDNTRADKQPLNTFNQIKLVNQSYSVKSFDDGRNFNEGTFSSSGYYTCGSNYSDHSYKSQIVGAGNVKITRSTFQGTECVADKARNDVHCRNAVLQETQQKVSVKQSDCRRRNGFRGEVRDTIHESGPTLATLRCAKNALDTDNNSSIYNLNEVHKGTSSPLKEESPTHDPMSELTTKGKIRHDLTQEKVSSSLPEPKKSSNTGYTKSTYAVFVGNAGVKVYNTSIFASLPHTNKFMVKEKHKDSCGVARVKLVLKSSKSKRHVTTQYLYLCALQLCMWHKMFHHAPAALYMHIIICIYIICMHAVYS